MTTEQRARQLSASLAAHVSAYHSKTPVSPELTIAAAVDFLAACLATLHSSDPMVNASLMDVVTSTLKDRVIHYNEVPTAAHGRAH